MENFIIVAGSPNSGKTISTNKTIKKLLNDRFKVEKYFQDDSKEEFWEKLDRNGNETTGGSVVLRKNDKKIVVISYGDILKDLENLFKQINYEEYDAIVCCSHATRGKNIFEYFHKLIGNIDLRKARVIPLFKNLLSAHKKDKQENEHIADLIIALL